MITCPSACLILGQSLSWQFVKGPSPCTSTFRRSARPPRIPAAASSPSSQRRKSTVLSPPSLRGPLRGAHPPLPLDCVVTPSLRAHRRGPPRPREAPRVAPPPRRARLGGGRGVLFPRRVREG